MLGAHPSGYHAWNKHQHAKLSQKQAIMIEYGKNNDIAVLLFRQEG